MSLGRDFQSSRCPSFMLIILGQTNRRIRLFSFFPASNSGKFHQLQSRRWKIKRIDRVQSTSLTNRDYFRSTFILRFAYYEATMKCALEFQDPSVSCITRTGHKSQVRTVLHKSITISVPMSRNGAVSSRFRNETSHRSATISCPVYHETLSRNSCRSTVEQLIQ